jgi:hypothetical protein
MVVKCARAGAAVEVLFDARVAITGEQCLLLGEESGLVIFGRFQDAMPFGDFSRTEEGSESAR